MFFRVHQLHPILRSEQTCQKELLSLSRWQRRTLTRATAGTYKAQHFSDYIERVVGEIINIKFISINITTISTLIR